MGGTCCGICCGIRYGKVRPQPGEQELENKKGTMSSSAAEHPEDSEINGAWYKSVSSIQTNLPDRKMQVILQTLEWEPGFKGDIWYFAIPGKKLQNQDAEYNPHDQTQEAAYPEPVENSAHFEGERNVENTEMVAPESEEIKNSYNSNQTSIPDCEIQKQEIQPGQESDPVEIPALYEGEEQKVEDIKMAESEGGSEIKNDYNSSQASIPDCKAQRQEIQQILDQELQPKEGDTRYLVGTKWMTQWKQYVGYNPCDQAYTGLESAHPGPVDNSDLFEDQGLKSNILLNVDYDFLPPPAWKKLIEWYTLSEGSQPIGRSVVNGGDHSECYVKKCKVEVHPLMLKLCVYPETDVLTREFSTTTTIGNLALELRRIFNVPNEVECRVWHGSTMFSNPAQTLKDAVVLGVKTLTLEKRNANGTWPKEIDSLHASTMRQPERHSNSYGSYSYSYSFNQYQPGLCGLANLGNTCFMNSALQCLSNTQPLTAYFVGTHDDYKKHINRSNSPLGMSGAIAEAYAALIKRMWSGDFNHVHQGANRIKTEVEKYAPQFIGYNQQDAQEFLTFLLNGIHEDLNLVKEKPYFDMTVNTEGKLVEDVAEESWYNYLRRNQSVIVKVFQGLLKSTLDCPRCEKKTWVFDPFTFLSLPLPTTKETRCIIVTLMRAEHEEDPQANLQILRCKVTIPKKGCITDLKKEMSKLTRISLDMMVIDVYDRTNQTHRIVCDQESLFLIPQIGTFIHELRHPIGDQEWVQVPVYHRLQEDYRLFGLSVVVSIQRQQCTASHFYQAVLDKCRKYVRPWPAVKETRTTEDAESDEQMEIDEPEVTEMDTEENECIDESIRSQKEMSINGKQETVLFQLEVGRSGSSFLDFELLKHYHYPITSGIHIYCTWSHEVMKKCYDNHALVKSVEVHESCTDKERERKSGISLSDCIELFTEEKTVGIENAWYCSNCKRPVQVSKKCDLWKLPEILIIYLKRFCYNQYGLREKVDAMVDFPVSDLSLKSCNHGPDDVYDLFATINHVGGLAGGHYTACCKNSSTGSWYTFDDTRVSEVKTERIVSATAYVLFYQRRSEGHKVSNGLLAELFSEEMCRLEAKFRPHDTDKGQEEGTNEEGNKEKAREESEQYEQGSYKEEREIDREQLEEDQARQGVENEMSKINMRKQNASKSDDENCLSYL